MSIHISIIADKSGKTEEELAQIMSDCGVNVDSENCISASDMTKIMSKLLKVSTSIASKKLSIKKRNYSAESDNINIRRNKIVRKPKIDLNIQTETLPSQDKNSNNIEISVEENCNTETLDQQDVKMEAKSNAEIKSRPVVDTSDISEAEKLIRLKSAQKDVANEIDIIKNDTTSLENKQKNTEENEKPINTARSLREQNLRRQAQHMSNKSKKFEDSKEQASKSPQAKTKDSKVDNKERVFKDKVEETSTTVENQTKKNKLKAAKRNKLSNNKLVFNADNELEENRSYRRKKKKDKITDNQHAFVKPTAPVIKEITVSGAIKVSDLANKLSLKSSEIIRKLMTMGEIVSINDVVDQETVQLLVEELGHKFKLVERNTVADYMEFSNQADQNIRAPVVVVMGHVDHGKTSLLDAIRSTKVIEQEHGGITQHIGAYKVQTVSGGELTFLDTPGHAAFSAMRARGAKCTDIAIIVVAADDGVKPQTKEAIDHAKAAAIPMIVAINKIDKDSADLDKVKSELSQYDVLVEDWGGDIPCVPISAKKGTGISDLLEIVLLQAELLDLKAYFSGTAKGIILDSKIEKGRGTVASILVQQGKLAVGDIIVSGMRNGRIRKMLDDSGKSVNYALPSMPVEVLGLNGVCNAGDVAFAVESEKVAREVSSLYSEDYKNKLAKPAMSLESISKSKEATLSIVVKADMQGSAEAIVGMLSEIESEKIDIKIVRSGVGGINESDINLAILSNSIVLAFNVRADLGSKNLAKSSDIHIYYYSVIYELVDRVKAAVKGLEGPVYEEKIIGTSKVLDVFRASKYGLVAGCLVIEGFMKKTQLVRVLRDKTVIYVGKLESLRRFKDDVDVVQAGMECGVGLNNYTDVKAGDEIEVFEKILVE